MSRVKCRLRCASTIVVKILNPMVVRTKIIVADVIVVIHPRDDKATEMACLHKFIDKADGARCPMGRTRAKVTDAIAVKAKATDAIVPAILAKVTDAVKVTDAIVEAAYKYKERRAIYW